MLLEKHNALRDIKKGISDKEVIIKYGFPENMILIWVKNKEKCFKALQFAPNKKRKFREKDFEDKDKVVFQWFVSKRSQSIPHDSTLIN